MTLKKWNSIPTVYLYMGWLLINFSWVLSYQKDISKQSTAEGLWTSQDECLRSENIIVLQKEARYRRLSMTVGVYLSISNSALKIGS